MTKQPNNHQWQQKIGPFYELQWLDYLEKQGFVPSPQSAYKALPKQHHHSHYHQQLNQDLLTVIQHKAMLPKSMIEVGPSLGRSCFEAITHIPTLQSALLIEPSGLFAPELKRLLTAKEDAVLPSPLGNGKRQPLPFNTGVISDQCEHVNIKIINQEFTSSNSGQSFDLALCLNVIDQCEDPNLLVEDLKQTVKPQGLIQLACTYQWQKQYAQANEAKIKDIKDLFEPGLWALHHESEAAYKLRQNERFCHVFYSHTVIYQKMTSP